MANVLAVGTTAAQSTTFTVAAGTPAHISLIGAVTQLPPNLGLQLEKLGSDTKWYPKGVITADRVIYGAGSYRLNRPAGPNVGADVD